MNNLLLRKVCKGCYIQIIKPEKYSSKQWKETIFCSRKCYFTKGRKGIQKKCICCNIFYYSYPSNFNQKYCSFKCKTSAQKGSSLSEEHKTKISLMLKGKKKSKEHILKLSGENSSAWKGGITEINHKIRTSVEYLDWRKHVFDRDDYTCQACGIRGGKLHADHELPFALYPDLRLEILNGRTLCMPCHRETPTWGRPKNQASLICS